MRFSNAVYEILEKKLEVRSSVQSVVEAQCHTYIYYKIVQGE